MIAESAVSAAANQKNAHKALRLLEEARRLHAGVRIELCTVQVIYVTVLLCVSIGMVRYAKPCRALMMCRGPKRSRVCA